MRNVFIIFDKKTLSNLFKYGPVKARRDLIIYIYQNNPDVKLIEGLNLFKEFLEIETLSIQISGNLVEIINKFVDLLHKIVHENFYPYIALSENTICSANSIIALLLASLIQCNNSASRKIYYIIYYDDYCLLLNNREILGLITYSIFENIYPRKKSMLRRAIDTLISLGSANNRKLASTLNLSEKSTAEFTKLLEKLYIIESCMIGREKIYLLNRVLKSFVLKENEPYFCIPYEPNYKKLTVFVNSKRTLSFVFPGYRILNIKKIYYVGVLEKEKFMKLLSVIDFPSNSFECIKIDKGPEVLASKLKEQSPEEVIEFHIEIDSRVIDLLKEFISICLKFNANALFNIHYDNHIVSFTPRQFENFFINKLSRDEEKLLKALAEASMEIDKDLHKQYEMLAKIFNTYDFKPMPYNVFNKVLKGLKIIENKRKEMRRNLHRIFSRNGIDYSHTKWREFLETLDQKELIKLDDKEIKVSDLVKVYYSKNEKHRRIIDFLNKIASRIKS